MEVNAKNEPASAEASAGKRRKLALVMPGGGMRCVYGAGAMTALVEEYGLTEPDIIIASSGGAGNVAYYLSGQYREIVAVWLSLIPSKHLISFRRRKILNIDYLVDEILKKKHPFDFKTFASARTLLLFAATRVRDGETTYLKVPRDEQVYEYLRATAAVPIVYGKRVTIGGDEYVDGDFGSDTEDLVQKAFALGAQDVIIIESSPSQFLSKEKRLVMKALRTIEKAEKNTGMVKAIDRELTKKPPIVAPKGRRVIYVTPSKNLHNGTLQNKKLKLRTVFNVGYADTRDNKELRELLAQKT